jgi:hypothetical protein
MPRGNDDDILLLGSVQATVKSRYLICKAKAEMMALDEVIAQSYQHVDASNRWLRLFRDKSLPGTDVPWFIP